MNYWPAESCNLTETTPPLFSFLGRLSNAGEKTAKELYGCRGWVAHTVTNVWGFTAPGWHLSWGMHPTGGAWLALHLWEHYAYNSDTTFLRDTAYPILKKAAEFFLDYLVPHPQYGWLVAGPSNSPENVYRDDSHQHHFIDMGVTCDRVLIYDIFRACISASHILDHDGAFRAQLETTITKLSPFQIGKNGRLQEWLLDYEDVHPEHRHTCHLLALYPGDQIDVRITPELAQAARKTIDLRRIQKHWEGTGWSYGNFLGYYARLGDGEKSWDDIGHVVNDITAPNLLICHPALAGAQNYIYELDGNTGFTAAIAEILLQSHLHEVRILPALPQAWTEGAVIGLCARGGFVVDISWKDGTLTCVTILSRSGGLLTLRYKEKIVEIPTQAQTAYAWDGNLNRIP
jgi:alpha-L-fucosidase 2